MAIEYMDSFEAPAYATTQRYSRNVVAGAFQAGAGGIGRGSTTTTNLGSLQINGPCYIGRTVVAEATKFCGVAHKMNASGRSGIMTFNEGTGTICHVSVGWDASGHIEVRRGTNTTGNTLLGTSTLAPRIIGNWHHVEAKVVIHATTGSVQVKVDEIVVLTLINQNTKNGGTGVIDEIALGGDVMGGFPYDYYDDWIIQNAAATGFLGDKAVGYAPANAAGTFSAATASSGTLVSCVSEQAQASDGNYITMDNTSLPKAATFNVANAGSNVLAILAVQPIVNLRKDDAGANTGRALLISGATTDDGGVDVAVPATYISAPLRVMETDPNTGAAWTIANFNAIEVGWRRVA